MDLISPLYLYAAVSALLLHLWKRWQQSLQVLTPFRFQRVANIRSTQPSKSEHGLKHALEVLIDQEGAGSWPPCASHSDGPAFIRPYHDIYHAMAPLLATFTPSLDDEINNEKRATFRSLMAQKLHEQVDVPSVIELLGEAKAGNFRNISRECYNGFYCTIALLRHAYRWATIPVVRSAQAEMMIDFPWELDAPWGYLNEYFGCASDGGNLTSNILLNFDKHGRHVYKINAGLSAAILSSEEEFSRLFYDLETQALPVYKGIVGAIRAFESSDMASCVQHLRNMNTHFRLACKVFYDKLQEGKIAHDHWLAYCQGFQAWGAGRIINGEFTRYDGLSGSHALLFQATDAFLGLGRYLPDSEMDRYIPRRQREFSDALRKHTSDAFRCNAAVKAELDTLTQQLKIFRASHRARAMPYLLQPAPERMVMTAGKSVIETEATKSAEEALQPLDDLLVGRLRATNALTSTCPMRSGGPVPELKVIG